MKASEALDWYEHATRQDGTEYYRRRDGLTDEQGEQAKALAYAAHNGMMPDDTKYQMLVEVLRFYAESEEYGVDIEECDPFDAAESLTAPYTSVSLQWLATSLARVDYLTQAVQRHSEIAEADGGTLLHLAHETEWIEVAEVTRAWLLSN